MSERLASGKRVCRFVFGNPIDSDSLGRSPFEIVFAGSELACPFAKSLLCRTRALPPGSCDCRSIPVPTPPFRPAGSQLTQAVPSPHATRSSLGNDDRAWSFAPAGLPYFGLQNPANASSKSGHGTWPGIERPNAVVHGLRGPAPINVSIFLSENRSETGSRMILRSWLQVSRKRFQKECEP